MLEMNLIGKPRRLVGVNTLMLVRFEDASAAVLKDEAAPTRPFYAQGTASINKTRSKFDGGSLSVAGSGRLYTPDSPELQLTTEWTIEMWMYPNSQEGWFFAKNTLGYQDCLKTFNGSLYLQTKAKYGVVSAAEITPGRWQHYAAVNHNGRTMLFIDGVKKMDFEDIEGGFGLNSKEFCISGSAIDSSSSNAYYDEFRISKVARYTENFTPPTSRFILD